MPRKKDDPNRLQGHVGSAKVGAVVEVYWPAADVWRCGRIKKVFEKKVGGVCSSCLAFISVSDGGSPSQSTIVPAMLKGTTVDKHSLWDGSNVHSDFFIPVNGHNKSC